MIWRLGAELHLTQAAVRGTRGLPNGLGEELGVHVSRLLFVDQCSGKESDQMGGVSLLSVMSDIPSAVRYLSLIHISHAALRPT